MKLLVVSNLYPPFVIGGYELNCANVVEELRRTGHDVIVATGFSHLPAQTEDPPYIRRCLSLKAFVPNQDLLPHNVRTFFTDVSVFENVAAIAQLAKEFRPDVIFFWNLHGVGGLHLIDFANTHSIPWAMYLGDRYPEHIVNAAPTLSLSVLGGHDPSRFAAGAVMAVSQTLVDEICRLGRFSFPKQPSLVYGYANVSETYSSTREYRTSGITRFITAGFVDEHKGTRIICEAARLVLDSGKSNFEINIYGPGKIPTFVSLADSFGLSNHMRFHGQVSQSFLHSEFLRHDAFLFPTWEREPFAFVPFEAAAYGCVPILTATCGCCERIVDGVHGIKIERSAEALAQAMMEFISGEIPIEHIGRNAARMVRKDLTLSLHVERILDTIKERCSRTWDTSALDDPRSTLLQFVKHHVALCIAREQS